MSTPLSRPQSAPTPTPARIASGAGIPAIAATTEPTTFAIGTAPSYSNADEGWGIPQVPAFSGDQDLSWHLVESLTEAEFDQSSAVNVKSAFFFLKEAGRNLNDNGKIVTIVTSLLGAFTPFYAAYEGLKAPVEHFTRAASKEFGERGISVTAIGPGPMDTAFFYGQESPEAQAYHKSAAALSPFSKTGLTDIEDIAPWIRFLVTEGWWMTGQTILVNGGYTTK